MTNEERLKIFSDNLNAKIEVSGKQQKDIAAALDIPAQSMNNWCKGKAMPRWKTLQNLADYFECPVTDFVYSNEEMSISFQIEREMRRMDDANLKVLLSYAKFINEGRNKDG